MIPSKPKYGKKAIKLVLTYKNHNKIMTNNKMSYKKMVVVKLSTNSDLYSKIC